MSKDVMTRHRERLVEKHYQETLARFTDTFGAPDDEGAVRLSLLWQHLHHFARSGALPTCPPTQTGADSQPPSTESLAIAS